MWKFSKVVFKQVFYKDFDQNIDNLYYEPRYPIMNHVILLCTTTMVHGKWWTAVMIKQKICWSLTLWWYYVCDQFTGLLSIRYSSFRIINSCFNEIKLYICVKLVWIIQFTSGLRTSDRILIQKLLINMLLQVDGILGIKVVKRGNS